MGVASRVASYTERWPGGFIAPARAGGSYPVTFPAALLRVRVELLLGGAWVDVSSLVLYENRIRINRGRKPGQRRAGAASCRLTFKNPDKWLSPRNVSSPWYGLLRRNTPLRVWLNPGSGDSLRFTGNVPQWPAVARGHPNDRRVTVTAYGVRNRLERGTEPPALSAQYRYLSAQSTLSYRPMEGEGGNTVPGPPGSAPLPDLARGGSFSDVFGARRRTGIAHVGEGGSVAVGSDSSWRVEVDAKYPLGQGGAGNYAVVLKWLCNGAVGQWRLFDDTTGIGLIYNTSSDGVAHFIQSSVNAYDGLWHHYRIDVSQSGANISVTLYQDGISILSTSIASLTMGQVSSWLVTDETPDMGAERMPAVGHVVIQGPIPSSSESYEAFTGWTGETAAGRFARICGEEGISATVNELYVDAITMGPQLPASVPTILDECENACEGLIDDTVGGELRLSTLRSRYNGALMMTLDYGSTGVADILPPLAPSDNDGGMNDWTITRPGGGTGQYVKTTGPNNINDPEDDPQGIGHYADGDEVNLSTDGSLIHSAGWRVHRDTVDEPRYPSVKFSLTKSPRLIPAWRACDIGSRIAITNGPDDVGPADPDLILEGFEEVFDQTDWTADAYLEPASVYRVALVAPASGWETTTPRLDCSGSTLSTALNTTTTAVALAITDTCVWTHDYGDYPITIGGEDMMVTAVTAAAGTYPARTQTLTVTRSVNGAVLSHAAGAEVHVRHPIILAR